MIAFHLGGALFLFRWIFREPRVDGVLFHLLLDGMWTDAEKFFWPFFGLDFEAGAEPFWAQAWDRARSDAWRWIAEAAGIAYLAWLWRWAGLGEAGRRRSFFQTGVLEHAAPSGEARPG